MGPTFQETVVLLLNDSSNAAVGAWGVIVNEPISEEWVPRLTTVSNRQAATATRGATSEQALFAAERNTGTEEPAATTSSTMASQDGSIDGKKNNDNPPAETVTSAVHSGVDFRRGGPVCGGRLGVVRYVVLHTFSPSATQGSGVLEREGNNNASTESTTSNRPRTADGYASHSVAHDSDHRDGIPHSLPIFNHGHDGQHPPLQFVTSDNNHGLPATFSEEDLTNVIQRLGSSSRATSNMNDTTTAATDPSGNNQQTLQNRVLIFSGYCKWRAGQLEREIQRDDWGVCVNGTPHDVLRHHDTGFWREISSSGRLLSLQQLTNED